MSRYEPLPGNTQDQDQLLVLTDDKGRITYASSAFCRLCGFDEDTLKAEGFSQLRHPNMPKGPLNDLWETLGRNDSWMGMIRNRNARGNDLWLDAFVTPISDEHGQVVEYQAIYQVPDGATVQRTQQVYQARARGKQPLALKLPGLAPATQQWLLATLLFSPLLIAGLMAQPALFAVLFTLSSALCGLALFLLNRPLQALSRYCQGIVDHPIKQLVYTGQAGTVGKIQLAMRLVETRLNVMIARVRDSGSQIEGYVGQANTLLQASTQASEQQLSGLSTVAASVEEFSATIREVSESTHQAANLSARNRESGNDSARSAAAALDSIRTLARELDEAGEIVQELDQNSQAIGRILDVINAIAEQTNLLALNAAIEAARAGENGRGFAVVADEVRSLAKRTQQSTDEVREMITALQEGSARVVESMEKGKRQSAASVEQVSASAEALQAIVAGINESDGLNQQIAAATEQQSQTVSQLSQEIHTIHQLASQTCHQLADTVNAGESVGHHVFRQKFLIKHLMPASASNARQVQLKEKVS
ncbi:MAG: PAS domain-containing methyl-accepting chemotaxis protein [Pseudomonadota bacterium]|nr:PAS domain-containing methyl-accepting chemotaxis protein [Pseudomonadota bacterium]